MPGKNTTKYEVCFESFDGKVQELHCVIVDLEKQYDSVLREDLWYCTVRERAV